LSIVDNAATRADVPPVPLTYQRLEHPKKGPVHVWFPKKYDPADGVTVFVPGFGDGKPWYSDVAIDQFSIERKLKGTMSRAALVVIESKVGKGKPIYWRDLDELVTFLIENVVNTDTRPWPIERVHAIGHSGAYDNISQWLKNPKLKQVTLLDATYGKMSYFASWFLRSEDHFLDVAVSKGMPTHKNTFKVFQKIPSYHVWQKIPDHEMDFIDVSRAGQMVLNYQHMNWVERDDAMMFFLTRAQMVRDSLKN
jgi:hypothetical protein